MLMFLVLIFVGIFEQLGGDLPMLTQIVVKGSNILRTYWYIVFRLVIIGFSASRRRSRAGGSGIASG